MNKEQTKKYMKEYRRTHKDRIEQRGKEYYHKYYQSHRDEILERSRNYYQSHKAEKKIKKYKYRQKAKAEVLTYYGKGKLACVRCGYSNIDALSIDHINGNGGKHRTVIGNSMYLWLRRNEYPSGFQTLCMNCQYIKRDEKVEYAI